MATPTVGTSLNAQSASASTLTFTSFNASAYNMLHVGAGDRVAASTSTFNTTEVFTAKTGSSHTASEARQFYLYAPTATTANVVVVFVGSGNVAAILTPLSGTINTVSAVANGGANTNETALSTGNITCVSGDLLIAFWAHGNAGTNTFNTPTGGTSPTIQLQATGAGDQYATTTGIANTTPINMGLTNSAASVYASSGFSISGIASGPTNLKSLDTNVKANIKSYNTNPIANIKSINGNS